VPAVPTYLTTFVGRQAELTEIQRLLRSTRLLTLSRATCRTTQLDADETIAREGWAELQHQVVNQVPAADLIA
jgi:hypothetical protein